MHHVPDQSLIDDALLFNIMMSGCASIQLQSSPGKTNC